MPRELAQPPRSKRSRTPRTDRFESAAFRGDCPRCAYPWPLPFEADLEGAPPAPAPNRCSECGLTHAARHRFIRAYRDNAALQTHHRRTLGVLAPLLYILPLAAIFGPIIVMMLFATTGRGGILSALPIYIVTLGVWVIGPLVGLLLCLRLFKSDRADRLLCGREHRWARWCAVAPIALYGTILVLIVSSYNPPNWVTNTVLIPLFVLGIGGLLALPIFAVRRLTVIAARLGAFHVARKAERLVRTFLIVYALAITPFIVQALLSTFPGMPGTPAIVGLPSTLLSLVAFVAVVIVLSKTISAMYQVCGMLHSERAPARRSRRSRTPRTDRFERALQGDCPRCGRSSTLALEADLKHSSASKRCPDCRLTHAAGRRFTHAYRGNTKLQRRHRGAIARLAGLLHLTSVAAAITIIVTFLLDPFFEVFGLFGLIIVMPYAALVFFTTCLAPLLATCLVSPLFKDDRPDRVMFRSELTLARWGVVAAIVFFPVMLAIALTSVNLSGNTPNALLLVLASIGAIALLALPIFTARRLTVIGARAGAFDRARKAERLGRTIIGVYAIIAITLSMPAMARAYPGAPGMSAMLGWPSTLLNAAACVAAVFLLVKSAMVMNRVRAALGDDGLAIALAFTPPPSPGPRPGQGSGRASASAPTP